MPLGNTISSYNLLQPSTPSSQKFGVISLFFVLSRFSRTTLRLFPRTGGSLALIERSGPGAHRRRLLPELLAAAAVLLGVIGGDTCSRGPAVMPGRGTLAKSPAWRSAHVTAPPPLRRAERTRTQTARQKMGTRHAMATTREHLPG